MSFNQLGDRDARRSLKSINVLCVEPQKQFLVVKQSKEVVSDIRPIVPRVQLLGQGEEGLGVVKEKAKFKDGLRVRDVILLKVAVETTSRGSEVRDATGCADASPHHDHDPPAGSGTKQLSYILQRELHLLTVAPTSKAA